MLRRVLDSGGLLLGQWFAPLQRVMELWTM
jgi:hypothetical protein